MKYLKALTLAVSALAFSASMANAADSAYGKILGFDLGAAVYAAPGDSRLSGEAITFKVSIPVAESTEVGVYIENGNLTGEDGNVFQKVDVLVKQFRVNHEIIGNEAYGLDLLLGFGYADLDNANDNANELAIDLGVSAAVLKGSGKLSSTEISIDLVYRYLQAAGFDPFAAAGDDVEDLGGLVVGLGIGIDF